ncbi:hypothetical protein A9Q91_01865 [Candidatus Gracilibacteria bacterium 28_42_T64]|nr:hypothetical protein A9Q91_01865 [Candidatus Gracilibacteria bacterium 28_42_T64]
MRKLIHILFIFIIIFFVNFIFYFISDDYKFFLKKIKDSDSIIYTEEKIVNDNFEIDDIGESNIVTVKPALSESTEHEISTQVVLGNNYKEIRYLFSEYDLKKIELNANIFDITNEYPDVYYEYYGQDLTLYFFTSKTYTEVQDIFQVLEYELPIQLNELNNFGDSSFYINLNEDIKDRFVRIILEINGVVVGLKVKRDNYNDIKQKLINFNNPEQNINKEK